MSNFKIVVPQGTINKVVNPSAETTGNFAAEAGTTVTRSTTFQHYGLYSYRVETNANNEGIEITLSALANAIHYVTVRARGTLPASWDWSLDGSTFTAPTLIEQIDSNWALYGLQFPAAQANGSTKLEIHQNGAGSGDFYLDGIQVEEKEVWTTYCDGTQPGCEWLGTPNAATSQRSSQSRAGGQVLDLQTDYGFQISGMAGAGTAVLDLGIDEYALLPGGELNSAKVKARVMTLTGTITGATPADLHAKRQALTLLFDKDAYPKDQNGYQPARLQYWGAAVHKQIAVHYDDGLDGNIQHSDACGWEKVAVRFLADNPYWYEIGESAVALDTEDSATFRGISGRLRTTGQWNNLSSVTGWLADNVNAIAEDAQYIYIGGNFQNFNNIANADYIARFNKNTQTWSAMGTGMNAEVKSIVVGPDGTVYAGGGFTTAGGVAANRIAAWDGSSWSALSTGVSGQIQGLSIGLDGTLYGATSADVQAWDGTSWSSLGAANSNVNTTAVGPDGTLYAGGAFTLMDGVTANFIAAWDGSSWSALGSGMDNQVWAIGFLPNRNLVAGGQFTTAGGVSASRVAEWNGTAWFPLGDGLNAFVRTLSVGPDGTVYVGGDFTAAGQIGTYSGAAKWNGSTWAHLDIQIASAAAVPFYIYPSRFVDPVIPKKYDLYVGWFGADGSGTFAGLVTPNNEGTAEVFPVIKYNRSGGTSATIATLRNERTGKEILFNYALLDGETLTIDLAPTQKSIVSSIFGPRQDARLPGSDFGSWSLLAGENDITSFVINDAATVTAWMQWKDAYKGQD